jgi:hypothetical protein
MGKLDSLKDAFSGLSSKAKIFVVLFTIGIILVGSIFVIVALTPVNSNTLNDTPIAVPTLVLNQNSTVFYVGDTTQLIATLSQPIAGIGVYFYDNNSAVFANGNNLVSTNASGVAVFDVLFTSVDTQSFNATAWIT